MSKTIPARNLRVVVELNFTRQSRSRLRNVSKSTGRVTQPNSEKLVCAFIFIGLHYCGAVSLEICRRNQSCHHFSSPPGKWITLLQLLSSQMVDFKILPLLYEAAASLGSSDLLVRSEPSEPLRSSGEADSRFPKSELKMKRQLWIFMHHVSGTNSPKRAELLQPSVPYW